MPSASCICNSFQEKGLAHFLHDPVSFGRPNGQYHSQSIGDDAGCTAPGQEGKVVAVSCEFLSGVTFICSIEAYFKIILYVAMSLYDITKLTFSFVISITYVHSSSFLYHYV